MHSEIVCRAVAYLRVLINVSISYSKLLFQIMGGFTEGGKHPSTRVDRGNAGSKKLPYALIVLDKMYFWTDSSIVLYDIKNIKTRFWTYVVNRLGDIWKWSKR